MTVAPSIIHVESPHVIRNLKDRLQKREAEVMGWYETCPSWDEHNRVRGHLKGLRDALELLDHIEKQERN